MCTKTVKSCACILSSTPNRIFGWNLSGAGAPELEGPVDPKKEDSDQNLRYEEYHGASPFERPLPPD
ncbi:hypothetical protein BGZ82_010667, partial [Podila clonocystis]